MLACLLSAKLIKPSRNPQMSPLVLGHGRYRLFLFFWLNALIFTFNNQDAVAGCEVPRTEPDLLVQPPLHLMSNLHNLPFFQELACIKLSA